MFEYLNDNVNHPSVAKSILHEITVQALALAHGKIENWDLRCTYIIIYMYLFIFTYITTSRLASVLKIIP